MIFPYERFSAQTPVDAAESIISADKRILGHVTLYDLIMPDGVPLEIVHGIYVFFAADNRTSLYVGKVVSPQFIERIPSHLGLREGSWFNQFLRAHMNHSNASSLPEAARSAFHCHLVLLPTPHNLIKNLEKLLIVALKPKYNRAIPRANLLNAVLDTDTVSTALQRF